MEKGTANILKSLICLILKRSSFSFWRANLAEIWCALSCDEIISFNSIKFDYFLVWCDLSRDFAWKPRPAHPTRMLDSGEGLEARACVHWLCVWCVFYVRCEYLGRWGCEVAMNMICHRRAWTQTKSSANNHAGKTNKKNMRKRKHERRRRTGS